MTYLYAGQNDIVSVADTEPEFGPANTRLSPADPSLTQEETDNAFGSNLSPAVTVASTRATYDDGVKPGTSNSLEFPISIISPVPQGHFVRGQGKRKVKPVKGHWLLTSTPNMEEVIAKNRPKDPPEKKKMQVKKVLFDNGKSNIKKKQPKPKRQRQTVQSMESSSDADFFAENDDDEDCPCIYCNDLYTRSKPGESWLRCMSCFRWAHASCADVSKKTKKIICELCL